MKNAKWVMRGLVPVVLVCGFLVGCPPRGGDPTLGPRGTFMLSLGGAHTDLLTQGFEAADGGFFFTGMISSTSAALGLYAIKTAADGYVEWWWPVHPAEGSLTGLAAHEPTPGEFTAIGLNRQRPVVADIDPAGIGHTLTESDSEQLSMANSYWRAFAEARAAVIENGYLLTLAANGQYDDEQLLVRLADDGTEMWRTTVGYDGTEDVAPQVAVDALGRIALATTQVAFRIYSEPLHTAYNSFSIRILDGTGAVLEDRWYGGEEDSLWMTSIAPIPDGGLYVGVLNDENASEVLRLGQDGSVVWRKAFGGGTIAQIGYNLSSPRSFPARAMTVAENGDLIFADTVVFDDLGARSDRILLQRIDPGGNEVWRRIHGGNGEDQVRHISQTSDGGFLLVGTTSSFVHVGDSQNGFVIKTNSRGEAPRIPQGFGFLDQHKRR